jgi:hypothetical protein
MQRATRVRMTRSLPRRVPWLRRAPSNPTSPVTPSRTVCPKCLGALSHDVRAARGRTAARAWRTGKPLERLDIAPFGDGAIILRGAPLELASVQRSDRYGVSRSDPAYEPSARGTTLFQERLALYALTVLGIAVSYWPAFYAVWSNEPGLSKANRGRAHRVTLDARSWSFTRLSGSAAGAGRSRPPGSRASTSPTTAPSGSFSVASSSGIRAPASAFSRACSRSPACYRCGR